MASCAHLVYGEGMRRGITRGRAVIALSVAAAIHPGSTGRAVAQQYTYPTPLPQDQPWEPQAAEPTPEPEKVSSHRGFQGGFNIGAPVFLDVDRDVVRPGADLHFFGGYDMGYGLFGIDLGAMFTPIDLGDVPGVMPGSDPGRSPTTRLYFAPEVRVQVPNESPLLPYVAMTFDANWWHFRETEVACNFWYCAQVNVFRFTPGFTAKVGLAFRIKQGAHIDVGAKYSFSGTGSFFRDRQQWVTGYLGFFIR